MPEIKTSTKRDREAVYASIEYIQDRLKQHPTIDLIAKYSGIPSKDARAAVSKMSRENLLCSEFVDSKEYIYRNK